MKTANHIRIVIADDHKLLRDGIIAMLKGVDNITIVDDVASGEEAINAVTAHNPDVVLMDIVMGGMTGIEATRWIKEQSSHCKVILISMEVTKEYLSNGIKCGVSGYLPKNSSRECLIEAIETVFNGGKYFPETVKNIVFQDFSFREKLKAPEKRQLPNDLTKREWEILGLVAQGKTNQEIADELFISAKTVDTHKTHVLEKMQFKNIAMLVKFAVKNHIVSV
jgi:DNA-binding NarL/FixJ family response regulator